MAWAAILAVAAAGVKATGTMYRGEAESAQFEASAKANEYNAMVKRARAETVMQAYGLREEQLRRSARIQAGSRRAAISQSGTGTGGSNADLDRQSEVFAELDAMNIRYQGELEHDALIQDAAGDDYNAAMNRRSGEYAEQSAMIGAVGDLLGGGAQAAGFSGGSPGTGTGPAPKLYSMYGDYSTSRTG